jgi:hypothetical protein
MAHLQPPRRILWECRHSGGLWLPLPDELFLPGWPYESPHPNEVLGEHLSLVMPEKLLAQANRRARRLDHAPATAHRPFTWDDHDMQQAGYLTLLDQAARAACRVRA